MGKQVKMSTFSSLQTTSQEVHKLSKLQSKQSILRQILLTINFFSKYGFPEKIVTDQETQSEGHLLLNFVNEVAKNTKLRTTSYGPQCNGNSERFNSTLINMIKTLEHEDKV